MRKRWCWVLCVLRHQKTLKSKFVVLVGVFFFFFVFRRQSNTSCRRARWIVWKALSLCRLCPSAPAPRVHQSTAWLMVQTTALRWPWCKRENRQLPPTALSFTVPLYVEISESCVCINFCPLLWSTTLNRAHLSIRLVITSTMTHINPKWSRRSSSCRRPLGGGCTETETILQPSAQPP